MVLEAEQPLYQWHRAIFNLVERHCLNSSSIKVEALMTLIREPLFNRLHLARFFNSMSNSTATSSITGATKIYLINQWKAIHRVPKAVKALQRQSHIPTSICMEDHHLLWWWPIMGLARRVHQEEVSLTMHLRQPSHWCSISFSISRLHRQVAII